MKITCACTSTVYKSYHRCVSTRTCKLMRSSLSQSMLVYCWSGSAAVSAQRIFHSYDIKTKQYHILFNVLQNNQNRRFSYYLHFSSIRYYSVHLRAASSNHKSLHDSIDESFLFYAHVDSSWIALLLLFSKSTAMRLASAWAGIYMDVMHALLTPLMSQVLTQP